jgi:hypothetical protein
MIYHIVPAVGELPKVNNDCFQVPVIVGSIQWVGFRWFPSIQKVKISLLFEIDFPEHLSLPESIPELFRLDSAN